MLDLYFSTCRKKSASLGLSRLQLKLRQPFIMRCHPSAPADSLVGSRILGRGSDAGMIGVGPGIENFCVGRRGRDWVHGRWHPGSGSDGALDVSTAAPPTGCA